MCASDPLVLRSIWRNFSIKNHKANFEKDLEKSRPAPRSRRPEAENHKGFRASVREAADILVVINSASGARATPDNPSGVKARAASARSAGGSGSRPVRPYWLTCGPPCFMRNCGCWETIGPRRCACCGLQPCGIRARDQCGVGSRSGRAKKLACA